jgi:hypothetical protein
VDLASAVLQSATLENYLRADFLPRTRAAITSNNSGVFARFRDPRPPDPAPDPGRSMNNAAFTAGIPV